MTTADPIGEIRGVFERFGDVESVEMVKPGVSSHIGGHGNKATVEFEAYVQFKQSIDAYKTIKNELFPKNLTHLVPADTWHQPEYNAQHNRLKPKLIFECKHTKCDKPIAELECALDELSLCGADMMCEHASIKYELDLESGTTLDEVRRKLLYVKPFLGDLTLTLCSGFDTEFDEDSIEKGNFQRRLIEIIGTNAAGPKLREMSINEIGGISKMMLDHLAPALKRLTTLTIDTDYCNILYLMHFYCPNLVTFNLLGKQWQGDGDDANIQTWPTLTRLVLRGISLDVNSDTDEGKRLRRFIKVNPQLNSLEIDFMVDNTLLKVICKGLRDLKLLTIDRNTFDGVGGIFNHLARLKRLQTVMISTWLFKTSHFKSLLSCIECFSKMKRLELSTMLQTYVHDEKKVIFIQKFPVTYHHDCNCHGQDSRFLTFGDHTDPIPLPKDKQSTVIVVAVARDLKLADHTLEARINTMFRATKKFYPNVQKTIVIPEDKRFVFLHVASTL